MSLAVSLRDWRRRIQGAAAGAPANGAPRRWLEMLREYFRYHGVMAPGVRVMRSLTVGGKIALVCAACVLPMVYLGHALDARAVDQAASLQQQLARVAQWRQVHALLHTLSEQRRAEVATLAGAALPPAAPAQPAPGADAAVQAKAANAANEANPVNAHDSARAAPAAAVAALAPAATLGARGQADWARLQQSLAQLAAAAPGAARWQAQVGTTEALLAYARWVGQGELDRTAQVEAAEQTEFATQRLAALAAEVAAVGELAAMGNLPPGDATLRFRLGVRLAELERTYADVVFRADRLAEAGQQAAADLALDVEPFVRGVHAQGAAALQGAAAGTLAAALLAESRLAAQGIQKLQQVAMGELQQRLEAGLAQRQRERGTALALLALMCAAQLYLLVAFHRVLAGGMVKVIDQVRRMATGDLSERPTAHGRDEVAGALTSLSSSLGMLAEMFAHVRHGVAAVAHASGEIARGNGELSQRTADSRQGLQRMVDAVRACVALLDECGRRVDDTVEVVEAMRLDAAKSRANMDALQQRMHGLQRKSGEINAIVELIDGIAFRTNILALNASIEAAKAGETGRGFAVVAQEVRRLAQRSAENARQISDIIGRSREDIERGSALADSTCADLKGTDGLVLRVHEAMREVAQLTRQGQQRSQEIMQEVDGLGTLTEANGTLVHQIADASQALSHQGAELSARVEGFKLR